MWNRSSYKGKRRQLSIATNVMWTSTNCNTGKATRHHKQFYIYVESGFSATSKELPSAFKILHGRPGWQMWNRSSYKGKRRQMSCFKRTSTNSCNTGKATRHQQLWMWTKLVLSPEVNRKHMQQILLLKRVNWSTSQLMLKQLTLLHRFVIYRTTRRRSFG